MVHRNISGSYRLLDNTPAQAWQLAQLSNRQKLEDQACQRLTGSHVSVSAYCSITVGGHRRLHTAFHHVQDAVVQAHN